MGTKLTRRDLAAVLSASPLLAQPRVRTPQEDLRARLEEQGATSKKLSAFDLPMATEPAFQFKA